MPGREALLRQAGSAEAFLAMRRAYAASLAAVSVTGYVTGSGDRHLDNYLLEAATGALVPIDFGCAALAGARVLARGGVLPVKGLRFPCPSKEDTALP